MACEDGIMTTYSDHTLQTAIQLVDVLQNILKTLWLWSGGSKWWHVHGTPYGCYISNQELPLLLEVGLGVRSVGRHDDLDGMLKWE